MSVESSVAINWETPKQRSDPHRAMRVVRTLVLLLRTTRAARLTNNDPNHCETPVPSEPVLTEKIQVFSLS